MSKESKESSKETSKTLSSTSRLRSTIARMRQCLTDDHGATAIEYALVAAGVGAAIAATVFGFGSSLKTTFYDKIAALL
jgi:Flp pilus assembly pilin Flp